MSKQDGSQRQVSAPTVDSSTSPILHVDLDAFFASVELLDRPELAAHPVVVAHDSPRSVVTAANYPARRFGVRSAMPLSQAKRLCPSAVVLEPHFEKYRHYSRQVMAIFDDMTPLVERLGIDEAFLDVSGAGRVLGSPGEIAQRIRERVRAETGLACSVGAASTKFVAKLASGRAKPDGLLVIPAAETLRFLHPLPVSALWGVGAATEKALERHALHTIGDIAASPRSALERSLGAALGAKLHDLANGIDHRQVTPERVEKSIGHEMTFSTDVRDDDQLRRELLRLSNRVGERLRRGGLEAGTVALKVRYADFTTISRSHRLATPSDLGRTIYTEARALLDALGEHPPVRLIGVRAEQLAAAGGAPLALWETEPGWRDAERTVDGVAQRFGLDSLRPASLLSSPRGERLRED
ncbi:DNA polymerase IV [Salinibacterium sp. SYSU T00001]|uniref:DNA polymerase IV n=1 Tax=Homoserinimonas sedimenticola TaxID=2986805 RepID=UPI0022366649|nr:DNA polymerase IV [Salinibacterium sedimenticola]MCW4384745.1 DNA polymerase IV [Salinibacterium sedimenticola]